MQWQRFLGIMTVVLTLVLAGLTLASSAWAAEYKVLHTFTGAEGANPEGRLILDAAGNLYGVTPYGDRSGGCPYDYGCGTVFKLAPNPDGSWTHTVLHSFEGGSDGQFPHDVIFDASGNLYGTTTSAGGKGCSKYGGCGAVFKLTPNPDGSWTNTVLYSFGDNDGHFPGAGVTLDAAGNLYGTTCCGDAHPYGMVFKLTPNPDGSWTESVVYSFTGGTDGYGPQILILDATGNLYGTTNNGGGYRSGTVFELSPNPDGSWTKRILYRFKGGQDGSGPIGGVAFDPTGNLCGTTYSGGGGPCSNGCGTVFMLAPNPDGTWNYSMSHRFGRGRLVFDDKPGFWPWDSLAFDPAGNLYATTQYGGANNSGTVTKLSPIPGGRMQGRVLYSFCTQPQCSDGARPTGSLILDAAGNLYGVTPFGGDANNNGVVFQVTP
jgi:hypothetical protein